MVVELEDEGCCLLSLFPKNKLENGACSGAHMDCPVMARTDKEKVQRADAVNSSCLGGWLSKCYHSCQNVLVL
jgi:hypothetical protein